MCIFLLTFFLIYIYAPFFICAAAAVMMKLNPYPLKTDLKEVRQV